MSNLLAGSSEHFAASVKRSAIAALALESKLPFDQVARLYDKELAKLERTAQVKRFLPIFTFKHVQEQLLHLQPA